MFIPEKRNYKNTIQVQFKQCAILTSQYLLLLVYTISIKHLFRIVRYFIRITISSR